MNIGIILRILPILLLGKIASCNNSTRQIDRSENSTMSNDSGNSVLTKKIPPKPCRKHLNRVKSLMFPSKFRPFIPLCDSEGYYLALQCHQSSRHCWCVDKNGNMKPGTKTKGPIHCGLKALKKPCEIHRSRALKHQANSYRSVFIPKCNDDGYYAPMQCTIKNKYCWCVNKDGNKKKGSRTKGLADCSKSIQRVDESVDRNLVDAYSANGAADGPCSQHKKRMNVLKANVKRRLFNPTCDDNGFYAKKQCHSGYCWCSDRAGNLIAGSRRKGEVSCESGMSSGPTRPPKSRCYVERLQALKSQILKKQFVPLCSPDGLYAPLQCDSDQGYCWCADKWGREIKNTRTKRTPNCLTNVFSSQKKTPCYKLKKHLKHLPTIGRINIPVCKRDGFFRPLQCSRDKRYCWCVEQDGKEIEGTVMFGKPKCPERSMNMTYVKITNGPCIRHKEKRKKLQIAFRRLMFNPRCNRNGFYDVKQCHGKYCWCTDQHGKMMRGTKALRGSVNCEKSSNPHVKPCLASRRRALRISLIKKPYIPQCGPDGTYTPLQCNVYTGVCWCVDIRGKERAGTRTRRTPNCFANAFNTIEDGPCHILKSYISKLPPNNKISVPLCEGSGFFQPAQCNKNNGFCWCVMHDGTEVQGSITSGKPECHEKRFPAAPRFDGPCDEHLAHVTNMVFEERKDVYTPVCDNEGYYAPLQCNNDTTWCWCTDRYGSMIKGTRKQGILPVCDEKILKPCTAFKRKKNEVSKSNVNDVYDAVCTENGYFAPLQCNMDSGNCWCADNMGSVVAGTTIYQRPYCGKKQRKCEIERRKILSEDQPVKVPPSCDVHGYYSRMQCDHITQECWCTDRYGNETMGTRIKGIANCDQMPRPCDEHLLSVLNHDDLFGVFIPQCDSQGYYSKIQCHEKTAVCWCSNKLGVEIPGTKTKSKPNCV